MLTDSRVLIAGGEKDGQPVDSVELFDPVSGSIHSIPGLITERKGHTATLLKSGEVLIIGGVDKTGSALASAELYKQ